MRFVERHGWKVFVGLSLVLILFGVGDMSQGGETYRSGEAVLFQSVIGMTWGELSAADPGTARLIDQPGTEHRRCTARIRCCRAWPSRLQRCVAGTVGLVRNVALADVVPAHLREFWIVQPDLSVGIPVPLVSGSIFLVITVLTLGLSYRRYLRKA